MAELTDAEKIEIVKRLACFEDIADVMRDFQSRGIDTDHKQIGIYDPSKSYYAAGEKLRELFELARKAYVEDVSAIPIASQAYRLNELEKLFRKAVRANAVEIAADLLAQASKETGGIFTNSRELNVNDSRGTDPRLLTDEQRRARFEDIIREAIEQMPARIGQTVQ